MPPVGWNRQSAASWSATMSGLSWAICLASSLARPSKLLAWSSRKVRSTADSTGMGSCPVSAAMMYVWSVPSSMFCVMILTDESRWWPSAAAQPATAKLRSGEGKELTKHGFLLEDLAKSSGVASVRVWTNHQLFDMRGDLSKGGDSERPVAMMQLNHEENMGSAGRRVFRNLPGFDGIRARSPPERS